MTMKFGEKLMSISSLLIIVGVQAPSSRPSGYGLQDIVPMWRGGSYAIDGIYRRVTK
jgi:hypothetical protein